MHLSSRARCDSSGVSQAMWKPAEDEWSILEVVNHLAEEETDDFRVRLGQLLEDPRKAWPPIDPETSVVKNQLQHTRSSGIPPSVYA